VDEVREVTAEAAGLDIVEVLQSRPVGRFQLVTFFLCVLILFVDGLDYSAANVAAPSILRAFNVGNNEMALVFASGYFGIFVGSVVFGYLGDRFGRKTGALLGVLAYSMPALLTFLATSLNEVALLRCLAGLGIGGVMPNIVALLTETAPKRARMTFTMAAFIGYSLGNAAIGQVAAWLIPQFGWSIPFLVAGVAGIALSLVLVFALPESIPFLLETRPDSPRLPRLIRRAAPDLVLTSDKPLMARRREAMARFSLGLLFSGSRRIATTLLWVAFFAEALTYMTLTAWLPVLLERAGLAPTQASLAYSYAQLGAIVAILIVARLLDRFGPKAAVLSATAAVAAVIALGTQGLSAMALTLIAVAAIACGSATHQSLLGIVGSFYPTAIRGKGIGYASGMGRIAAIIGPAMAGYLLSRLPLAYVVLLIAIPDLVVAAACIALDRCARESTGDAFAAAEQLTKTA
jgi:AAHS family 4-hydroxybenzoate transporter-like MFS transporter